MENDEFRRIADTVLSWAVSRDFRGTDPYDGLNSRLLRPVLGSSRLLRLAVIQIVKNSPFDPRRVLLVPQGRNPKGLALFLSGLGLRSGHRPPGEGDPERNIMMHLTQMLLSLASRPDGSPVFSADREFRNDITPSEVAGAGPIGWGYDFPWQSRAFLQPAWFPTAVCSAFVLDALRDSGSSFFPPVAAGLAAFVMGSLNRHTDGSGLIFSYSPKDDSRVFNASLFAARILACASSFPGIVGGEKAADYVRTAREACRYVLKRQRGDGSWVYGEAEHWQWVDGLHTGFVLEAMKDISDLVGSHECGQAVARGMDFYRTSMFTEDGTAKYYSDRIRPIDPHCFAQGAITLNRAGFREDAKRVLERAVTLLWIEGLDGFGFRKNRVGMLKEQIHMRWSQGWMFKALCDYLHNPSGGGREDLV